MKKNCDLCQQHAARMYCESDQASLCWHCDAKVHAANFLVARHSRTLLCHCCQSPTPWTASGANLGPTFSVCHACVTNRSKSESVRGDSVIVDGNHVAVEKADDRGEDVENVDFDEEESVEADDEEEEEDEEEDEEDDFDDDGDGDNQVVPWSASPPPAASSSTSEDSFSQTLETSIRSSAKRMREDVEVSWQNDVDSLSLQPRSSAGDDEATSFCPFRHKRRLLLRSAASTAAQAEPFGLRNFWGQESDDSGAEVWENSARSQGSAPDDVVHHVSATTSGSGDRPVSIDQVADCGVLRSS